MPHLWDPASDEPEDARKAFSYFLRLGTARTLEEAYRRAKADRSTGPSMAPWQQWAQQYSWVARARSFDDWSRRASVGERLQDHWASQPDLGLNPPATAEDVADFENRFHVLLPPDMREAYEQANGYDGFDLQSFIKLWPLKHVAPQTRDPLTFDFADWSINAEIYLIHLSRAPGASNEVVALDNRRVAGSFSEFVELYLTGSMELY